MKIFSLNKSTNWTDVSVLLHENMISWPGNPRVRIKRTRDMEQGESHNVSEITFGSHSGTHVDAPLHFLHQGKGIDKMPLDIATCEVRVISIHDPELIKVEELETHHLNQVECILFKTRNSSREWHRKEFSENFVAISKEAAHYLVEKKTRLVGIDYLSVGNPEHDGEEVHRILLRAGVWVIEGLDLTRIVPGFYEMVCLPLMIKDGDGAPARVILKQILNMESDSD